MLPKTTNNNDIHAPRFRGAWLSLLFVVLGEDNYHYYLLSLGSIIIIIISCYWGKQ
jgi:hypothetical protein